MTTVHGKNGAILVGTADCSPFTNSIEWEQSPDNHDTTCFGATGHTYAAGLLDGKVSLKGVYDTTAITGPRAAIKVKLGADAFAFKYRPEGIGSGKPETTCQVVLSSYKESVPIDDMVTWEAEFQISGAPTDSTQT